MTRELLYETLGDMPAKDDQELIFVEDRAGKQWVLVSVRREQGAVILSPLSGAEIAEQEGSR